MNNLIKKSLLSSFISILTALACSAEDTLLKDLEITTEIAFDYSIYSNDGVADGVPTPYANGADNSFLFNSGQAFITKKSDQTQIMFRAFYLVTDYFDGTTTTSRNLLSLDQIEIRHPLSPYLSFGFGRMDTTMGFESYFRHENAFYTTSYAYSSMLPGFGNGIRFIYANEDQKPWAVTLSSYDEASTTSPWRENSRTRKGTELSVAYSTEELTAFAGVLVGTDLTGAEDQFTDIYLKYSGFADWILGLNYASKIHKNTSGPLNYISSLIAEAKYLRNEKNHLAARIEYVRGAQDPMIKSDSSIHDFQDDVAAFGLANRIYLSKNLSFSLELNHHVSPKESFKDQKGNLTKSLTFGTIGILAAF